MRNSNSRSDESGGFGEGSLPPAGSLRSTAARASRARQRGLLCCAFAATAIPLPTRADDYYFQPTSGSSPWNWDSSISPYFSWRNNTLSINADSPTNGANAYLIQSGALGIANATVLFNYAYSGPGLTSLQIDSKNALMQSDPSSAMIVSSVEYIGYLGNGSYTQSGGANTAGDFVGIGFLVGATGAYNQTGGTLTTGGLAIGNQGTGVFNQSGKSINSVLGTTGVPGLYVGLGPAGNGTYNLSDSATLNVVASEFIGYQGTGVFNQSGGINTLGFRGLTVGSGSTGNGTYALSGGNLVLPIAFEVIGLFGNGTFIQSGGTHTINGGTLSVGQSGGGSGTYTLSGGSLVLLANSIEYIGDAGNGTFIQSGGTHTINRGSLTVGQSGGGSGTYTLSGGTLALIGSSEIVGNSGKGTFNQSGGTHTITSILTLAAFAGASGTYNLQGGSLTAGTVQVNVGGTFNQTGGTLSYTTFNLNGGTVTGTLQNQGTFNYLSGTFPGRLVNQGAVNLGNNFTAGNGMENDSVLSISTGQTITLGGAGLDNEGTLTLSGGTLVPSSTAVNVNRGNFSLYPGGPFQLGTATFLNGGAFNLNGSLLNGSGAVTNSAGGTINGPGTIAAPFANAGGVMTVQNGSLNITQPFVNTGNIQLLSAVANLSGGTVTNGGTLSGLGNIANNIANFGTIEAIGGTLNLGGVVTNISGGLLAASTGSKVLVTGGLETNAGTISLVGGTFDNNGKPLTNTGEISGYGILRSGGLTNNPGNGITLTGGFTTINGPVTNAAGGSIRVNYNPALFTSAVVNNGTIKTLNTTVTFAGSYSGSGTYNSDPATNIFQSDINVLPGGQVLGGTGDQFIVLGTYTNAGFYQNAGGTLTAQNIINQGQFNQPAGQATLNALSGTGATSLGGGGTSLVSLASFDQGSISINNGGDLLVRSAPSHITNAVNSFTIASNGLLDLQNHHLLIDNTATPFTRVHQYIDAAYNRNVGTGFGDYNGRGGITSGVVKANVDFMSVGYYNGALQNPANPDYVGQVLGPNSNSGAGTGIALTQILVRPTLTGDLNGDGVVNSYDVNLFNTFGLFGSPTNLGYQAGDLNGDGVVNSKDVTIFNSAGNFNNGSYLVAKAASTLTGRSASPAAELNPASGTMAFTYDPATGDVKVNYNGFTGFAGKQTFNTTNRALSLIDILSTGGPFALDSSKLTPAALNALSSPTFTGNTEINLTAVNGYLPDGTDLGRILAPGLDPAQLAGALTLTFNYTGSRQLSGGVAGLIVPEPTTLSLLGLGAMGLLSRRRRIAARH